MRALALATILVGGLISASTAQGRPLDQSQCLRPWMYFDLGDTIVDTRDIDPKTKKPVNVRYMPGALDYLRQLKSRGYQLGLISNVPADWGATHAERYRRLKAFVQEGWVDREPMHWELFDLGALLPLNQEQRKPQPFLFEKAADLARAQDCPAIYQGEAPAEIKAAESARLYPFEIGKAPDRFLPESKIPMLISSAAD